MKLEGAGETGREPETKMVKLLSNAARRLSAVQPEGGFGWWRLCGVGKQEFEWSSGTRKA